MLFANFSMVLVGFLSSNNSANQPAINTVATATDKKYPKSAYGPINALLNGPSDLKLIGTKDENGNMRTLKRTSFDSVYVCYKMNLPRDMLWL